MLHGIKRPSGWSLVSVEALARYADDIRRKRASHLPTPKERERIRQKSAAVADVFSTSSIASGRMPLSNAKTAAAKKTLSVLAAAGPLTSTLAPQSTSARASHSDTVAAAVPTVAQDWPPSATFQADVERRMVAMQRLRERFREVHLQNDDGDDASTTRSFRREGTASYRKKQLRLRAELLYNNHPAKLFSDEDAVVQAFGMGCFVSPDAPAFTAIFRQRWQDFQVTELESEDAPLSRDYDFSIPPLPRGMHSIATEAVQPPRDAKQGSHHLTNATTAGESAEEHDVAKSFFTVDVREQVGKTYNLGAAQPQQQEQVATDAPDKGPSTPQGDVVWYLQCFLHKQHMAHQTAMSLLAQHLRVHPSAITVAGIKDFIGDTIQRVRVSGTSPASLLAINDVISSKRATRKLSPRDTNLVVSHLSYHTEPLKPGKLFGNHFKITLRHVSGATEAQIHDAMEQFRTRGFPNYYGCQRFSWFGGKSDVAFAMLHHNWLVFAFRLLNYTDERLTLRQLLQRRKKYPHAVQDAYRRNVVRRLRGCHLEPTDIDQPMFNAEPALGDSFEAATQSSDLNPKQRLVVSILRDAFFDLSLSSRRLTAQRLGSFFWNQALSLRLHYFGPDEVLVGDMVYPKHLRNAFSAVTAEANQHHSPKTMRRGSVQRSRNVALSPQVTGATVQPAFADTSPDELMTVVTAENKHLFTIEDVVHPAFKFENSPLPDNDVAIFYKQICDKYRLDWAFRHAKCQLTDFIDPPRPIIRKPINVQYHYAKASCTLVVEFALERGCYANVAVTELLKATQCLGSEKILRVPVPSHLWHDLGDRDPGYVETMQDVYIPPHVHTDDAEQVGSTAQDEDTMTSLNEQQQREEQNLFDWFEDEKRRHNGAEPTLFTDPNQSVFKKAERWSERNLVRNSVRREQDADRLRHSLFESPLASTVTDDELSHYAGHHIPMPPNTQGKKRMFFKVKQRASRFSGAPKFVPRVKLGAQIQNAKHKRASFSTLSSNTWNVTW